MKLSQVPKYKFSALQKFMSQLLTALEKEEKDLEGNNLFNSQPYETELNVTRLSQDAMESLDEPELRVQAEGYISALDDLDQEDFFGSEGWRHYLMGED